MMTLADDITISVAGKEITLRPSLRHAIRLERREGSFAKLMRDVAEESLTAAVDIIRLHAPTITPAQVFDAGLSNLKYPLIAYVGRCTGIDADDVPAEGTAKGKAESKTVTIAEHLENLYRIGTGWLGWTPAATLDSTPGEIMEAYKGRMDMLRAIFGSGDDKAKTGTSDIPLEDKIKFIFRGRSAAKAE